MASKTVKVRIAVAVNEDGEWVACGNSGWDDGESEGEAIFILGDEATPDTHFVIAEVPLPEPDKPHEVRGEVERG